MNKILLTLFFAFLCIALSAQKKDDSRSGNVECGGSDFGFSSNGFLYNSGDDFYVCESNLPIRITASDLLNNVTPYISSNFIWVNADPLTGLSHTQVL